MDLDTKYQNLEREHFCKNCQSDVSSPMHCGHAMHLEHYENNTEWVCWMGRKCGHKEYSTCCENSSLSVLEPLDY